MSVTISSALQGSSGPAAAPLSATSQVVRQQVAAATAQATAGTAAPQPQPSSEQVQKAIENLKRVVTPMAQNLEFSVDSDTHTTVIRVVDTTTKEVIRQIPSEEVLSLARDLDKLQGLLLKRQA